MTQLPPSPAELQLQLQTIYQGWRRSDYIAASTSNLVRHALHELSAIGYPHCNMPPDSGVDWAYNYNFATGVMDLVKQFADQGHSGFSGSHMIATLGQLLDFKPLTPITADPAEWNQVSDRGAEQWWQCARDGSLFSFDRGKTYYRLGETRRLWRLVPWRLARRLSQKNRAKLMYKFHTSAEPATRPATDDTAKEN